MNAPQSTESFALLGNRWLTFAQILAIACLEAECAKAMIHLRVDRLIAQRLAEEAKGRRLAA